MKKDIFRKIEAFALSELYTPVMFLAVYALIVFDKPVWAVGFLLLASCAICLACRDLVPMILPVTLLFCIGFLCPSDAGSHIALFVFALPCVPVWIYRFVRDVRGVQLGASFPGLVAVTVALLLGGLFCIPAHEYFSVGSLYHILLLGPGMVLLYLFFKSNTALPRQYCIADKVACAFYLAGAFLAFLVLRAYVVHADLLYGNGEIDELIRTAIPWRNTAANLMVTCLPFVFYYARKHHPLHAIAACVLYAVMLTSGSRGAAICGLFVLLLGFVYLAWGRRRTTLVLLSLLLLGGVAAYLLRAPLASLLDILFGFHNFGSNGDHFVETDGFNLFNETRFKMLLRSLQDFISAPIFGQGVGSMKNTDIYAPTASWAICWYHSLIPQIVGSLGLVGILAYGYQFFLRARLVWRAKRSAYTAALAFGYAALLIYSMIDPGLFSPVPYALIGTFFMVLLEEQAGEAGKLSPNSWFARLLSHFFGKSKSKNKSE